MVIGLDAVLSVENIRVKANHGWYKEERKIGGMYSVSVRMYHKVSPNEEFTTLESSLNYEIIYHEVLAIMKNEFHLIEESCKAIFDKMKSLDEASIWEIEMIKEEPPLKYTGQTKFVLKG